MYQTGPKVPCTTQADCQNQGLPQGWLDRYNRFLDCQWIDSTLLVENRAANKWYDYHISVNNGRRIVEYSYHNNRFDFPLFVPCPPAGNNQIVIQEYIAAHPEVCCSRPGGFNSVTCPNPGPAVCNSPAATLTSTACDYTIPFVY